jgi:hypothetical protein
MAKQPQPPKLPGVKAWGWKFQSGRMLAEAYQTKHGCQLANEMWMQPGKPIRVRIIDETELCKLLERVEASGE